MQAAIAALSGGLVRSGTASVQLYEPRAYLARLLLAAGAAVLLLLGLAVAAIAVPVLAPAVLALLTILRVLAVVVLVSLGVMLAGIVGPDRGKAPSRQDPAVREAVRWAHEHGYPRARVVTIAGLAGAPGRVDDVAGLVHDLLTTQRDVLIAGAADEQLRRRYRALGFKATTTGRRGLLRAPGPLTDAQLALLARLRR